MWILTTASTYGLLIVVCSPLAAAVAATGVRYQLGGLTVLASTVTFKVALHVFKY